MTKKKTTPKIVLTRVQDIPLDQLVLAQTNVRRIQHGLSIEELAEDIARRGLLQNLCVRPEFDEAGEPTGRYGVPAGGRRFRALQLLVQQKRMAKNAPIPCAIRTEGLAEEDSLAENVQRVALHPLDQFRAFATLQERGLSDEDIAARFFVPVTVVRQRLKLAAASPALLDLYATDALSLAQLEAFCVTDDHARQEEVWQALDASYNKEPYQIRRILTEGAVRADDRRAIFVGMEAFEHAGGRVLRDLFHQDRGGWLQDTPLLDGLARAKLDAEAEAIQAEGWRWVQVSLDHPYGEASGMRRLFGEVQALTPEQETEEAALRTEQEQLEAEHQDADEVPDAAAQRLDEIEAALASFEERTPVYTDEERAEAGVFVSLGAEGRVRIERGFIRRDQEAPSAGTEQDGDPRHAPGGDNPRGTHGGTTDPALKPLPDRLVTALTGWRTLALREAVAADPDVAALALLHALVLTRFYRGYRHSCLEIELRNVTLPLDAGLDDSVPAKALEARRVNWGRQLPTEPADLWQALVGMTENDRATLLAFCVAQAVNSLSDAGSRRQAGPLAADHLAEALRLDPVAAGWTTTEANYLGQVSKARIVGAVREARDEATATRLGGLRKADMAREAASLLAGSGWVPAPLRTPGSSTAMPEEGPAGADSDPGAYAIAAE